MILPIAVCGIALMGLLRAEKCQARWGVWLCKPVAATSYVWAAVAVGALDSNYGRWVLGALCLCWWGDVLLIPKNRRAWFRAGIVVFLLGHIGYIGAFLQLDPGWQGAGIGLLVAGALAWVIAKWLAPQLPAGFRRLVAAYVAVICTMLVTAFAAATGAGSARIALGASLFALSDVFVARDRFVAASFVNRALGLPLYFAAQLILASTVAG